ncbi:MAG: structural protein [Marinospirillum sp.]|nr:structural protein [Marinospirillum sp.]
MSSGVLMSTKKPRGIRNNNPGNIKHDGTQWQGLDNPASDGVFNRFISPEYGIRAVARILNTYQTRHGLNTVRGIINRYAPPVENQTDSYVMHVSGVLGVGADYPINVNDHMMQLIKVIILHENGQQPYSDAVISKGIEMAGV